MVSKYGGHISERISKRWKGCREWQLGSTDLLGETEIVETALLGETPIQQLFD
jgi:hypothetical protein